MLPWMNPACEDEPVVAPVDETPPIIRGINVSVDDYLAVITWNTDEPATTQLDYLCNI